MSRRRSVFAAIVAVLAAGSITLLGVVGGGDGPGREPDRVLWSVFEEHDGLVREGAAKRDATLRELRALGVDTLRVSAKWNEIAPDAGSARRPDFDANDPGQYPGFDPYDDLVRRADVMGFRILMTIAPDAPRWASEARLPISREFVNFRPDAIEFGRFAGAVARRYAGDYRGLPAVRWFSIWNEPNHNVFLRPVSEAPEIYRDLVRAGVPAVRENAAPGARILVGETAPVELPGRIVGPTRFMRRWLCLDSRFRLLRGRAARRERCTDPPRVDIDGYAHHPYEPVKKRSRRLDVVGLRLIRRLGRSLDRAASAGSLPHGLPIYSTEFGFQTNPPDPTVETTLSRQAALLNENEELSYRYPRLRSYAQYLLYDDPPREGITERQVWSGFQTGLRFSDGAGKPAFDAYRLPIVVHRRGHGVYVWGHVRPGSGTRRVQLERRRGRDFVRAGQRIETDDAGYFSALLPRAGAYRFRAYHEDGRPLGISRIASPIE